MPLPTPDTKVETYLNALASGTNTPPGAPTGLLTDASGSLSDAASHTILAAGTRKYIILQNVGSVDMWVNFTTTATAASPSILLKALGVGVMVFEGNFVPTDAINAIGSGASYTLKYA
jgi:hypothetical protein